MRTGFAPWMISISMLVAMSCASPENGGVPLSGESTVDAGVVGGETGDGAAPSDGAAPPPAPPDPKANPTLIGLADNTALDLGKYDCAGRVPQMADRCYTIFDFSRFNYDPFGHRVLLFGGGHAATGRTDVDVLDLGTLAWQSLYPSMSCDDVKKNDVDPRGFHRDTGVPVSRHTYDQNVIAIVDGVGRFMMLSTEGFSGACHPTDREIKSIAYLELTPGNKTWKYSEEFTLPWHYSGAAEFDPPSGMVINIGQSRGAGSGGMWVIDPKTFAVVASVPSVHYKDIDNNLVYYPPTQKMYLFQRGEPGQVWEVTLDRTDWKKSTSAVIATSGVSPNGTTGYAYDPHTQLIGGGIDGGRFFTFDPATKTWSSQAMNVTSSSGETAGKIVAHHLDYDPINNVYYFVTRGGESFYHTWAYRLRK